MPSNAPITVNDGKSTPASHVFVPTRIDKDNKAFFAENVGSSLQGRPQLSYVTSGGVGGAAHKVALQITVPKLVTVTDGAGTREVVQHTPIAKTEFVFQSTTSAQERKDMRMLMANALIHATLGPAIDNVESFW